MIYLIGAILVLGPLIFIHELGHYLAAKLFGVRVERFSIGFPPRLAGFQVGDTDYCISAVPLGGYVKLSGMIDENLDDSNLTGADYEFMSKPVYQKVIIITAGVIMNFLLAVVILAGLNYYQGEVILPTTTVGAVADSSMVREMGLQPMDRILKIGDEEVNNWQEVQSAFFNQIGEDVAVIVERDGETVELALMGSQIEVKDLEGLMVAPLRSARVGAFTEDSRAKEAGLEVGDWIIAINDSAVGNWNEMATIVSANSEQPLQFTVRRDEDTLSYVIAPKFSEIDSSGKIGIGQYYEFRDMSLGAAIGEGFRQSVLIIDLHIKVFSWIFEGRVPAKDAVGGPLMIAKMAGDSVGRGAINVLSLIAQLSVVLAFINILPIPALDGGHLLIILIEGIRKKPLPVKGKMIVQQVGMLFLLALIFLVMYNDIMRFING